MTASGRVSPVSGRVSQSVFDGTRLRVVLLLEVADEDRRRFLDAYERMCRQVASTPGHIQDQVCQSVEDPSQWLITSEWESAPPFLAWVNSEEHLEMVRPLRACVRSMRSLRFGVLRQTGRGSVAGPPAEPRAGDVAVRHAVTYTVTPGSESKVAEILSGHPLPEAEEGVGLCGTALFLHGNRVVQTFELRQLDGDVLTSLLRVAARPEVRAVEEALAPYLERERELGEVSAARAFFTRAALPAVHHTVFARPAPPRVRRHALCYPARAGRGEELARLLAGQDGTSAADPGSPVCAATVFHRDDLVVRLVEMDGEADTAPAAVTGLAEPAAAAEAGRLLDGEALGLCGDPAAAHPPAVENRLLRLLARSGMRLLADRRAPGL
ncbi:SchA/CurD-like domain-containing protein [Streptomyces carminius]|uniref:SchA/CurD-like domain-containing protein n=1 Tax=Streptomyces carminius TaxID=2665496 RepID=UPI0018EE301F|nr:SchA/CurD-like domain-containing protein [Streptomyces carminius]